ncbi:MAG: helix-turn-helix domain-containing protein [Oscillospiraceae bacterium]|nr:helix-turn-helix domain-containing protein [Oscillospiraceae bacterium]
MTLYIGENLKKQRKLRELTQEQLADILGVSFQAVSKWERGEAYPDIELLPTIAEYFGITTDELMGMKEIRDSSEADKILDTVHENSVKGNIEENLKILEEAVKRFPNNFRLLAEYASNLTFVNWDREGEPYRRNNLKAIAIAERILAECTDPEIRGWMQGDLCHFYERSGQLDKAIEAADKLSPLWRSCEMTKMAFLKGEELIKFAQGVVSTLANAMYLTLWYLSDLDGKNDPQMTQEQRIEIQQKAIALYDIVFDKGDYNYYFHDVYHSYSHIASMAMGSGDRELALDSLEKAAEFAAADDDLPDKKPYTSLLVNRLEYNKKHSIKNFTFTYREELLEKLAWDGYDSIRDDPRFKAVESSLQK